MAANAHGISLERGRLGVVLATIVINIVAVLLLTFAPWSDWRTGAALNIVDNCLLVGFALVRHDALLGRFLLFGLVVGFAELPADAWLVDYTGTLDYSVGRGPRIWRSPLWMPLAWEVVAVQFGYIGLRLLERFGKAGLLMIALLGAINIPFYEEMARRIHWWQYSGCHMISFTPWYISLASSGLRSPSRCLRVRCDAARGGNLLLLVSAADFRSLFAMLRRFGLRIDWSGKTIHPQPAGACLVREKTESLSAFFADEEKSARSPEPSRRLRTN
jgi:hypothetical protein